MFFDVHGPFNKFSFLVCITSDTWCCKLITLKLPRFGSDSKLLPNTQLVCSHISLSNYRGHIEMLHFEPWVCRMIHCLCPDKFWKANLPQVSLASNESGGRTKRCLTPGGRAGPVSPLWTPTWGSWQPQGSCPTVAGRTWQASWPKISSWTGDWELSGLSICW